MKCLTQHKYYEKISVKSKNNDEGRDTKFTCKTLNWTCCEAPRYKMHSRYRLYFLQGKVVSTEQQAKSAPPRNKDTQCHLTSQQDYNTP